MTEADVAIVGGGPAGAVCATALARRGLNVVVLEARAFPRAKVCGEFLSPAAAAIRERYLDDAALAAAGAQPVEDLRLGVAGHVLARWRLPARAWSLSRARLDMLLLAAARAAGAQVYQPVRVREVQYGDDQVRVLTDDGLVRARCVVHADGTGRHDPAGPVPHRRDVLGLKCHLRLRRPLGPVLELHGLALEGEGGGRGYGGLVGVEGGACTLAMVVGAGLVRRFGGDHDALLRAVWPDAAAGHREGDWLCCPVAAGGYVPPGHPRSFRIGNAAAAVAPVAGEGIGLALWAGDWLGRGLDLTDLRRTQRDLAGAYRRRLRWRRPAAGLLAAGLARPALLRGTAPLLGWQPQWLLAPLYRLSGKPAASSAR